MEKKECFPQKIRGGGEAKDTEMAGLCEGLLVSREKPSKLAVINCKSVLQSSLEGHSPTQSSTQKVFKAPGKQLADFKE